MLSIAKTVLDNVRNLQDYFEKFPDRATLAAQYAINQTVARKFIPEIIKQAESEINFPVGYLRSQERVSFRQRATKNNLQAIVTARDRPTSLSRFASGQTPDTQRRGGLVVKVKAGGNAHRLSKRAFLVKLNNGNTGLAVRLPAGEKLRNTERGVLVKAWSTAKGNVFLLYGPSVEQVISTLAITALPNITDAVAVEFYRQFQRLSRG